MAVDAQTAAWHMKASADLEAQNKVIIQKQMELNSKYTSACRRDDRGEALRIQEELLSTTTQLLDNMYIAIIHLRKAGVING